MAAIDWSDPCQRAAALRDAYYALLSGAAKQQVTYQDSGTQRSVTFASSKADLTRLRDELRAAEEACDTITTPTQSKRVALRGGAMR